MSNLDTIFKVPLSGGGLILPLSFPQTLSREFRVHWRGGRTRPAWTGLRWSQGPMNSFFNIILSTEFKLSCLLCDHQFLKNLMWCSKKKKRCLFFPPPWEFQTPEKAMAPHSSTLAWRIPGMEEPGRLQSMQSLWVGPTEQLHFHFSLSCVRPKIRAFLPRRKNRATQ